MFGITHEQYLQMLSHYQLSAQLLLFSSGPLFPLSIIVLGIVLIRIKVTPVWQAVLLLIVGIAFPLSRIPRVVLMAHIADILLLIPCWFIAVKFLREANSS